jgi:copper(I)-binding protein
MIVRMRENTMMRRAAVLVLTFLAMTSAGARAASPVVVADAWAHPASGSVQVYATISNEGDAADRLIGATSPSATGYELHDGAHGAAPVAAIVVPPHGSVTFSPTGGYVQFTGLKADLADGGLFFARLHFENAGWIVAIVHVRTI